MDKGTENTSLVVFSTSARERELLRYSLAEGGAKVFCFENEAIFFDNLESIHPDIVIARTDSRITACRLIFAVHTLNVNSPVVILSDMLKAENIAFQGLSVAVHDMSLTDFGEKGYEKIFKYKIDVSNDDKSFGQPLLVGESESILKIKRELPYLSESKETILIKGEKGTGKELLGRLIAIGGSSEQIFVKINCADLSAPEISFNHTLYKSPLYTAGQGWFPHEYLQMGLPVCVLLDGVDRLPVNIQSQLLFLLEEYPNRSEGLIDNNTPAIRFIATSENNFETASDPGDIRKDLFYRLNVIPVEMPRLRERKEDIPLLIDYFITDICVQKKKSYQIITSDARERMCAHHWPGNLDELRGIVQRIAMTRDESFIHSLYKYPKGENSLLVSLDHMFNAAVLMDFKEIKRFLPEVNRYGLKSISDRFIARIEKKILQKALESTNWNRKKAAEIMGISYKSMLNKMKDYDMKVRLNIL
ncbi:MAG: sigma-54-dependent Fis family transcriptional regulator [Desulfobacteraceae bacterium]|nr:sigma-54-dependent Fis family transcriptional regulator [Desulfobacteraceae bacterium]